MKKKGQKSVRLTFVLNQEGNMNSYFEGHIVEQSSINMKYYRTSTNLVKIFEFKSGYWFSSRNVYSDGIALVT